MASAPFDKMLIASASIYKAPIGEAFPLVAAAPAGNWTLLAAPTDITEDGIEIETSVQDARIFSLGGVAPVKAGIVQRQFTLNFRVMNAALEQLAIAHGGATTAVVDNGLNKSFPLPASPTPQGYALLLRWDQSPEGDALNSQIEIKSAIQVGPAGGKFSKSEPFSQGYAFVALYTDANWVVYRVGDQAGT